MDLTNREIASLIWLAILIALACSNRAIRGGLAVVIKMLFMGPIVKVIVFALLYIALCVFALERAGVWEPANSKTTALWAFTFALLTVFDFKRLMEERLFFRSVLRETLSVTVILVFLVETYTLSLLAELTIVPIVTLLAIIYAMPPKTPAEMQLQRFLGGLLSLLGFGYLAYSAYQAIIQWNDFATAATAREFAVPLLLSLMFLPFLYWLRLYATYEQVFAGLRYAIPDKKLRAYARFRSILAFRQNLDLLKRWRRMMNVDQPTTKQAIKDSFRELRRLRRIEKDPPHVPPEQGWSPYSARRFLEAEGIETDDFHRSFDNEWRCASRPVKVAEGIFEPTISYYVTGSAEAATELALELDVFNIDDPTAADERFWHVAAILLARATSPEAAQEIAQAMGESETAEVRSGGVCIRVTKEDHHAVKGTSYERAFIVTRSEG